MWAWWLIFLLFAAALGYFATWYFVNNRIPNPEISHEEKTSESLQLFSMKSPRTLSWKMNSNLESRLQSIESKVNQYTNGQQDLMVKLAKLEGLRYPPQLNSATGIEEEGWEEMYYEAREAREQLEESAEKTAALLQEKDRIIAEMTEKNTFPGDAISLTSSQEDNVVLRKIAELEQKLDAALAEKELFRELSLKSDHSELIKSLRLENAAMKSELEDMHKYADSLLRKSFEIESKLDKLAQLKIELHNKEDEKMALRESVEEIFSENEKLALKIKELQDKLKERDLSQAEQE